MEDEYKIDETKIEVNPITAELAAKALSLDTDNCPGCGPQLGLKIALQEIENPILVNSSGCMSELGLPNSIHCGLNGAACASAVSKSYEGNVICYSGDGATHMNLQAVIAAAERRDNVIYICYNNQGYCYMGRPFKDLLSFAQVVPAMYSATASIAYPEDYAKKIRKALTIEGFKFIEILSPCPVILKSDPSNTVAIARMAVETGLWPLYEIRKKKMTLTHKIDKLEPIERYFELQERFKPSPEEMQALQESINKKWKYYSKKI